MAGGGKCIQVSGFESLGGKGVDFFVQHECIKEPQITRAARPSTGREATRREATGRLWWKNIEHSGLLHLCVPPLVHFNFVTFPLSGLFSVTIRQALFIAPCSHTFHYKCIRPLLEAHHPAFSCPLCRTFADLEEDVEVEDPDLGDAFDDDDDLPLDALDCEDGEFRAQVALDGRDADADGESPRVSGEHLGPSSTRAPSALAGAGADGDLLQPGSRAGSGLGVRHELGGAETEVEEGPSGLHAPRNRTARRVAHVRGVNPNGGAGGSGDRGGSPLDLTDEQDEDMVDVGAEMGMMGVIGAGMGADDAMDGVDVDGTVGGKRKR